MRGVYSFWARTMYVSAVSGECCTELGEYYGICSDKYKDKYV